jgi:hypothetical protein
MRKQENKKLDEIGKALVRSGATSSRDIERIVASPALFDSIRQRIALEPAKPITKRSFLRPSVAAFASVALIAATALAFVVFKSRSSEVVITPAPNIPTTAETKRFTEPDRIVDTDFRQADGPVKAQRISTQSNIRAYSRPKQPAAQQVRYEGDFYALSYAGDPNETERGGRIVRVDLPRSTLFAMGVDIPLENEADTVKADLLVGTDGVTRAIRVVK